MMDLHVCTYMSVTLQECRGVMLRNVEFWCIQSSDYDMICTCTCTYESGIWDNSTKEQLPVAYMYVVLSNHLRQAGVHVLLARPYP